MAEDIATPTTGTEESSLRSMHLSLPRSGILFGSGLVGGEGLLGVGIAAYAVAMGKKPEGVGSEWAGAAGPFVGLGLFCLLVLVFVRAARGERAG